MIIIKSPREVELMKKAGALTAKVFEVVGPLVKPGVSTQYLADMAEKVIVEGGGRSAEKGYCGYQRWIGFHACPSRLREDF